jgi:DNA polymerase elongation subunit (family B)
VRPLSTNRTRTFRADQYTFEPSPEYGFFERQERALVNDLVAELSKYDLLIGHNVESFDMGFLRTRAYRHTAPFFLEPFIYDTKKAFQRVRMRTVLNVVGKPSAAMDMVADFLGINQEKTKIYPVHHWQTVWGNDVERAEAMNDLVEHCQRDVRMNAQIYELLLPHDKKATIRRWQ